MENQPTTLDKAVKVSIIVGALIIALSIAYYLVIFVPQKEKARIEQQKQEQKDQQVKEQGEKTTRQNCQKESADKAIAVLKSRSEISPSYAKANNGAVNNGMYKKEDFDKYYDDCLSMSGLKR